MILVGGAKAVCDCAMNLALEANGKGQGCGSHVLWHSSIQSRCVDCNGASF